MNTNAVKSTSALRVVFLMSLGALLCWSAAAEELDAVVVATSGESVPDEAGSLTQLENPVIQGSGQAVFSSSISGPPLGSGFFRAGSSGLELIVAQGDPSPDGNGNFSSMAGDIPFVNDSGLVAFFNFLDNTLAIGIDQWAIFSGSGGPGPVKLIVRSNQLVPGGGGDRFGIIHEPLGFNNAGMVVFKSLTQNEVHGIWRGDGTPGSITRIVGEGDPSPSGDGVMTGVPSAELFFTVMNEASQVAFFDSVITQNGLRVGVFRGSSVGSLVKIARQGDPAPSGNGTISAFDITGGLSINDQGEVAFMVYFDGTSGGAGDNVALLRGSGATTVELVRKGQAAPDGNGSFRLEFPQAAVSLNNHGNLLLRSAMTGASGGATEGLFLAGSAGVVQIARLNEAAPGGGVFSGFSSVMALNNRNQVAFLAFVDDGGFNSIKGIFFYDDGALVSVAREGDLLPGFGTVTDVVTSTGLEGLTQAETTFLNDLGQVSYTFHAGNQSGIAISTPDACNEDAEIDLSGFSVFGVESYRACERITVSTVSVEAGGQLTLRAGGVVVIESGFRVKNGGKLTIVGG